MNLTLPGWVDDIFPEGKLLDAMLLWYETFGKTLYQRRINGGKLLRAMIEDMEAVKSGTIKRKISLYSGHETNIVAVLQALGVYHPHVPRYGSGILVEFHQVDSRYVVKIRYFRGIPAVTDVLTIPNCTEECDYETFVQLLQPVLPRDEEMRCD